MSARLGLAPPAQLLLSDNDDDDGADKCSASVVLFSMDLLLSYITRFLSEKVNTSRLNEHNVEAKKRYTSTRNSIQSKEHFSFFLSLFIEFGSFVVTIVFRIDIYLFYCISYIISSAVSIISCATLNFSYI